MPNIYDGQRGPFRPVVCVERSSGVTTRNDAHSERTEFGNHTIGLMSSVSINNGHGTFWRNAELTSFACQLAAGSVVLVNQKCRLPALCAALSYAVINSIRNGPQRSLEVCSKSANCCMFSAFAASTPKARARPTQSMSGRLISSMSFAVLPGSSVNCQHD